MKAKVFVACACFALSLGAEPLKGPEAWLNFMGGNVRKDGLRCEPYRCDISQYVVKGRNELRIEVTPMAPPVFLVL